MTNANTEDEFAKRPRMAEYMTALQLNTEGCLALVETVMEEASREYLNTAKEVAKYGKGSSKELMDHLTALRRFYMSEYFHNLSMGAINGKDVIASLDAMAGLTEDR